MELIRLKNMWPHRRVNALLICMFFDEVIKLKHPLAVRLLYGGVRFFNIPCTHGWNGGMTPRWEVVVDSDIAGLF